MAHSLARLHVHLVFATKRRTPWLTDAVRGPMHRYMAAVLERLGCPATLVNSVEDHVHVLFELSRTAAVGEVAEEIKKSSSKWLKTRGPEFADFAWQRGYGAFAVSASNMPRVRDYVARQQEHHRSRSFEGEYRALLARHGFDASEHPDALS
jgi:putative transposase